MRIFRKITMFCIGGGLYITLELLWRGRSHISMFLLGGSCFLLLGQLRRLRMPLPILAVPGACMVTVLELLTGLAVNRHYGVWDYRAMPMNIMGQICLPFSLLWVPVCWLAMGLYGKMEGIFNIKK